MKPAYRFVEHVGEVELGLEAATEAGIFEAALAAFAELVADGGDGAPTRCVIELAGCDHRLLLADWLSELVFLAEVEELTPECVAELDLTDCHLHAIVTGRRDAPRHFVKAVTLNELELSEREGAWHARVVLDV